MPTNEEIIESAAQFMSQGSTEMHDSLAQRGLSGPVAEASELAARAYTPRASIFTTEAQRSAARALGPLFFAQLVEEWRGCIACWQGDPQADTAIALLGTFVRVDNPDGRTFWKAMTPFSFVNTLARKVAKGEEFLEMIDFDQVVKKGGTLAEWSLKASMLVRIQMDKGAIPRYALDQSINAGLSQMFRQFSTR